MEKYNHYKIDKVFVTVASSTISPIKDSCRRGHRHASLIKAKLSNTVKMSN